MTADCAKHEFENRKRPMVTEVAGVRYIVDEASVRVCKLCGQERASADELARVELSIAQYLVDHGVYNPDAFRYMRKAIGLKSLELARLLGVEPETVTRWENGQNTLDLKATALLGDMVNDTVSGRSTTVDRLNALAAHAKEPSGLVSRSDAHVPAVSLRRAIAQRAV